MKLLKQNSERFLCTDKNKRMERLELDDGEKRKAEGVGLTPVQSAFWSAQCRTTVQRVFSTTRPVQFLARQLYSDVWSRYSTRCVQPSRISTKNTTSSTYFQTNGFSTAAGHRPKTPAWWIRKLHSLWFPVGSESWFFNQFYRSHPPKRDNYPHLVREVVLSTTAIQ